MNRKRRSADSVNIVHSNRSKASGKKRCNR